MKKINRKQKIIILIAIITIVVIIAIAFGANAIRVNIANGKYNSSNSGSNNGNLLPEYIKKGITLGGVTGTLESLDTSDATALPEDILWGKTAYVNGEKITGTYDNSTLAQLKRSGRTVSENTIVEDRYNNKIKVPAGFKIAKDSPITIPEGVVIEDSTAGNDDTKGSEFVWIPIRKYK